VVVDGGERAILRGAEAQTLARRRAVRDGPYICARVSTSLTGRPTSRAARMPSTCGPLSSFDPKPPPMKGLRMWMPSIGMPKSAARRICVSAKPCVGMSSDSASPSQAATTPCGSIALWNCVGVS
jgi:hypothetical protein